ELALASLEQPVEDEAARLDPSTPAGRLALRYLEACLAGERERAVDLVLGALGVKLSATEIYVDVLAPAQQEIGRLWHTGDATVVEERLVSETTRELLPLLAERARPRARNGHTVLAASVAGNAHD